MICILRFRPTTIFISILLAGTLHFYSCSGDNPVTPNGDDQDCFFILETLARELMLVARLRR